MVPEVSLMLPDPRTVLRAAVILAALSINLVSAGYDLLTSVALSGASTTHPFVFAFVRDICASALLFGVAYLKRYRGVRRDPGAYSTGEKAWPLLPKHEDLGLFIITGLLAVWSAQALGTTALMFAAPAFCAMFVPVSPVVTLLISMVLQHERFHPREWPSWVKVCGVAVTTGGGVMTAAAAFTSASDVKAHSKNLPLGVACLLLAKVVAVPVSTLLQKRLIVKYRHASMVAANTYLFGTAALFCSVVPLAGSPEFWSFPPPVATALLYAIFLASAVNFSSVAFVNKHLNPVLTTCTYPLETVFVALLSWLILGQSLSPLDAAGGSLIIAGLLLTVGAKWYEGYAPPYQKELVEVGAEVVGEEADMAAAAESAASEIEVANVHSVEGHTVAAKQPASSPLSSSYGSPAITSTNTTTTTTKRAESGMLQSVDLTEQAQQRPSAPTQLSSHSRRDGRSDSLSLALIAAAGGDGRNTSVRDGGDEHEEGEASDSEASPWLHRIHPPTPARVDSSSGDYRSQSFSAGTTARRVSCGIRHPAAAAAGGSGHRHRSTVFIEGVDDPDDDAVGITSMEMPVSVRSETRKKSAAPSSAHFHSATALQLPAGSRRSFFIPPGL